MEIKVSNTIFTTEKKYVANLPSREEHDYKLSLKNYIERCNCENDKLLNSIQIGDIAYFDFGQAYRYEIGYQHLGIVLGKSKRKLFVVPLISFKSTNLDDRFRIENMPEKMFLPNQDGLRNNSVALLNDAKWINYIRTIRIIGHIEEKGHLFNSLKLRVIQLMFG